MSWQDAEKPLSIIVALLTIVGAIYVFYRKIEGWLFHRLKVKQITRSDDRDLEDVWSIHQNEFTEAVADEFTDLQRWLDEDAQSRKTGTLQFDEFLLCVKSSGKVLGYLFAQYYIKSQLIFLSYVAVNTTLPMAKRRESEVVIKLFRELIRLIERQNYNWRGIVGEFESQRIGRFYSHAQMLMVAFQRTLRKLRDSFDPRAELYRICIDYRQPILRPDDLSSPAVDASYNQWLVFLPHDHEVIIQGWEDGGRFIDRTLALDILRFVYLDVYFDAFGDNDVYKKYLQEEFNKCAQKVPERIEVKSNWRAHEANERDQVKEALGLGGLSLPGVANHAAPSR